MKVDTQFTNNYSIILKLPSKIITLIFIIGTFTFIHDACHSIDYVLI